MAPIKSYFNIMSDEFDSTSLDPNDESGSFIIATVFFMFVFLMAASFGVDVTNYYNKRSKLQNIADGAALSTGRALQQYTDYPNTDKSIEAYQNYVRERQGKQKLETYASGQEQLENNLMVKRWETNCSKSSGPYVYYDDDGDSHDLPDPHNNCYGSNSDTFYVTGVTVFDHFEPYFLPESAFGQRSKGMSAHAVAVIEPKTRVKTIQSGGSAQCGLYVKQSMKISGNNFNAGVSPSLEVCGSATGASIDVDGNNNELGDVHLGNCSNLEVERHNSVGPCANDSQNGVPGLKSQYQNASGYVTVNPDVIMSSEKFDADPLNGEWRRNHCPSGYVQMETTSGDLLEWSKSSDPVCVSNSPSEFTPKATNAALNSVQSPSMTLDGKIQTTTGNDVNIEVQDYQVKWQDGGGLTGDLYQTTGGNVTLDGGNLAFDGDVYSDGGNIEIENNDQGNDDSFNGDVVTSNGSIKAYGNNHVFNGAVVALGGNDINIKGNNNTFNGNSKGIAIYSTQDADFDYNNTTINGILYAKQDVEFDNNGGGNLSINGFVTAGQDFDWSPNSGNTVVQHTPSNYDSSVLDLGNWGTGNPIQTTVQQPLFSNVSVRLVNTR